MEATLTSINRSEVAQVVDMTKGMLYMTLNGEDVVNILSIIIIEAIIENTESFEEATAIFGDVHAALAKNFKLTVFQQKNEDTFRKATNMSAFIIKNHATVSEQEVALKDKFLQTKDAIPTEKDLDQALENFKQDAIDLNEATTHYLPALNAEMEEEAKLKDLAIRYGTAVEKAANVVQSISILEQLPEMTEAQNEIYQEFTKGSVPIICGAELSKETILQDREKAEEQILRLTLMQTLVATEH